MIREAVSKTSFLFLQNNPAATIANVSVIGPPLAECLKDGSTPVRLAAERCAMHVFQLTKGIESS